MVFVSCTDVKMKIVHHRKIQKVKSKQSRLVCASTRLEGEKYLQCCIYWISLNVEIVNPMLHRVSTHCVSITRNTFSLRFVYCVYKIPYSIRCQHWQSCIHLTRLLLTLYWKNGWEWKRRVQNNRNCNTVKYGDRKITFHIVCQSLSSTFV